MERPVSCPSCRRGILADDAFCSWCGTRTQPRDAETGTSRRARVERTVATSEREGCPSCNSLLLPGDVFCATCGARQGTDAGEATFSDAWADIPGEVNRATGGKYEFVRELGRGGMGIVYLARDLELERPVAVKVLSPSWVTDESMLKRFQREARTIARLRHESIITVYSEGRAGGLSYFVMDYIEGVSVSRILRAHGALPIPVAEAILYRVGSGLDYAHRPGREIIHRDVKPSNIMVDSEGMAVLMDFGISRELQSEAGLTKTGMVIGTPEYMSPEQCRGHQVTTASDQYSLGAVAYAMITGAPPFTGPFYQVLMGHGSEPVPPIRERRPDCPPALAETVERMLAKHPGERWSTIREGLSAAGLRPVTFDDPAVQELARLVRECVDREEGTPGGSSSPETLRTPSSIRILPLPDDLEVGDEIHLEARALFPDGDEEPLGEVSWRSTDPAIARVDPATGQVTAVGAGTAVIEAAADTLSESLPVQVHPPRVVELDIQPADARIPVGRSLRFIAEPKTKRGETLARKVAWFSSDPNTASVADDGTVTAHRDGRVVVLAHCDGVGGSTKVTIGAVAGDAVAEAEAPPEAEAQTAPSAPSSSPTGAEEPTRLATPPPTPAPTPPTSSEDESDTPVRPATPVRPDTPAPLATPTAASTASTPASTAPTGTATARSGTSTARTAIPAGHVPPAVWMGGAAAAAAVALLWLGWGLLGPPDSAPPPPPGGTPELLIRTAQGEVGPGGLQAVVGDTMALGAVVLDPDGEEVDASVSWSSSAPEVAAVDPTGVVMALAEGTARILAGAEGATREVTVTVTGPAGPPPPASVDIRTAQGPVGPGGLQARVGETRTLSAVVAAADGTTLDVPLEWASSNPGVAQVNAAGTVSARAPGTVRIMARAGGVEREVTLTVQAAQQEEPERPPPPQSGTLVLRILPTWAHVTVNGVPHGERTAFDLSLPVGSHRLRLEHPAMITVDTTIVIEAGERLELNIRMQGGSL